MTLSRFLRGGAGGPGRLALLLPLALGAGLACFRLGAESFWLDEAFSFGVTERAWSELPRMLWREGNMCLYFLLLRGWAWFGSSEAWLRSLSAAFAVLSLVPAVALAKRLAGPREGLVFGLLLATNAAWLAAAQESRGYSLEVLLQVLGVWAVVRAARGDGPRFWTLGAAALGLAAYAHLSTAFTLIALGLWFLLVRKRIATAGLPGALALLAALLLPLGLRVALGPPANTAWIPPLDASTAWEALVSMAGVGRTAPLLLALLLACAGAGARALAREPVPPDEALRATRLLPLIWLAAGFAAPLLVSLAGPHVFLARYLVICVPPFLLLAARGLSLLRGKAAWAVALAVAALSVASLRVHFFKQPKEDWRSASQALFSRLAPGDPVAFYPVYNRPNIDYYRVRLAVAAPPMPDLGPMNARGGVDPGLAEALAHRQPRLWLAVSHACQLDLAGGGDIAVTALGRSYRLVERLDFFGVVLLRFASRSHPDAGPEPESPPRCSARADVAQGDGRPPADALRLSWPPASS